MRCETPFTTGIREVNERSGYHLSPSKKLWDSLGLSDVVKQFRMTCHYNQGVAMDSLGDECFQNLKAKDHGSLIYTNTSNAL